MSNRLARHTTGRTCWKISSACVPTITRRATSAPSSLFGMSCDVLWGTLSISGTSTTTTRKSTAGTTAPNKALHLNGHANDAFARHHVSIRVSRPVSLVVRRLSLITTQE
jgi:hypothetical protein